MTALIDKLREHERVWAERPLLRLVYRDLYELIASELAAGDGVTVELGGGLGNLRDVVPWAVVTDVEPTPWADEVVDAANLPYPDGSVANLIMLDVFHHLPHPSRFLSEAARTLRVGGRAVLVEPYCSPLANLAWRHFHHEDIELDVDPFAPQAQSSNTAMDANIALSTLVFFTHRRRFEELWPELAIVTARRFSFLSLPLSGGFSKPQLIPTRWFPALLRLERALSPVASLAAFRCLIVLERREVP